MATVAGPGKGRELNRQRYLIAALGIERWGLTAKPLAAQIGRLPEAVSRWASRCADLRQESEAFSSEYERLDQELAASQETERSPLPEQRLNRWSWHQYPNIQYLRRPIQVQARIKYATLAAARYGYRSTEVARFINKHPTTIALWITLGLRKQLEDQCFRERIDTLDRRISLRHGKTG